MAGLNGKRVAFLVANEALEQVELKRPWAAIQQRAHDRRREATVSA